MDNNQLPEQERPELLPEEIPTEPVLTELPEAEAVPPAAEDNLVQEEPAAMELPIENVLPPLSEPLPEEGSPIVEEEILPFGGNLLTEMPVSETVPEEEEIPALMSELQETRSEESTEQLSLPEDPELDFLNDPMFALPSEPEAPKEEVPDQEYRDNGKDFDTLYNAPATEEKADPLPRPARKGRPKRKKGEGLLGIPNILVTVVWLALILAIGVTLGRMLWICAADVLAFGREDKAVTITIYEADSMEDIVDKLHSAGLIRYKSLFNLYADISDAEEDIQPGIYDLNTRYDYHALVNFMSPRSSREVVEGLLIPEGYTCQQIFALLEENKVCTAQDIAAYAANGELGEYWFLNGVERGTENCLEGFLFPDTYDFYKNSSPREVLTKLLDNFESKFNEDMRARMEVLNSELTGNYGVREIVIVASLIEKESAAPAESPSIAGVIYNRLFSWEYPAFLNIDAAIVYAQGGEAEHIDTKLDSPYNTYTNIGLTPGPIANPGLSSLKAALYPESHNYYYYVLNPSTGMHQFSTTEAEHNAYVAEFYN